MDTGNILQDLYFDQICYDQIKLLAQSWVNVTIFGSSDRVIYFRFSVCLCCIFFLMNGFINNNAKSGECSILC